MKSKLILFSKCPRHKKKNSEWSRNLTISWACSAFKWSRLFRGDEWLQTHMGAPNKKDCFTRLQTAKHSENHRRSLGLSQPYYVIENLPINHLINIWILQHLHHQRSRDSYSEAAAYPKPSIKNDLENSKVSLLRWYAWLQRNLACEGPPYQFRPSETKRHGNPVPYHSSSYPRIYRHQAHQGKRVNFRYSQLLVRMSPWNLHRPNRERRVTYWNKMKCHMAASGMACHAMPCLRHVLVSW